MSSHMSQTKGRQTVAARGSEKIRPRVQGLSRSTPLRRQLDTENCGESMPEATAAAIQACVPKKPGNTYSRFLSHREQLLASLLSTDWQRINIDAIQASRSLGVLADYATTFPEHKLLEQWRTSLSLVRAVTRTILAYKPARAEGPGSHSHDDQTDAEKALRHQLALLVSGGRFGLPIELHSALFIQAGDYWTITFAGETAYLKASKGLSYLHRLLRHPKREFHACDLAGAVPDAESGTKQNEGEMCTESLPISFLSFPALDDKAKQAYRRELLELNEEMNEASAFSDTYRVSIIQERIAALTSHLAAAVGIGGKTRLAGSISERARCAVTKRIKEAMDRIGNAIPSVRQHLHASIKTGYFCSYDPPAGSDVNWDFGLTGGDVT